MKKRVISILLALIMICTLLPMSAFAATVIDSGACGDNVTWTLDSEGTLTISGTGAMYNYSISDTQPWHSNKSDILSVTIKDSVTSIGDCAFEYCDRLTSISIPNSVTTIGTGAFWGCENLTSINIPNSVTTIGAYAFWECNKLTSINIPNGVTTIGDFAFYSCDSLTSINIPDGVTTIGDYAFSSCGSLTSISIPNSVTSIGDWAFYSCDSLTSISIPDGVTSIGDSAFGGCSNLTNISIPDSVTTIGDYAFSPCASLTSINIPDSVTTIGDFGFCWCDNLTSISVASNNPKYSSDNGVLFNKDKSTLLSYPAGKSGTSYIIPDSVTTIGDYAFRHCDSLTSISIPSSVTTIGDQAFDWCDSLTSISIPSSVTTIGDCAFYYCDSLTDVYYSGTEAQWKSITIGFSNECLTDATIHYGIYNLGEETYSFKNFGDKDSKGGHCFGMAMTSSAYYLGILDISNIGAKNGVLYNVDKNQTVTAPICYYQAIQGWYSNSALVAGGSYYLNGAFNISADWTSVINYIKNHQYDDTGKLQVAIRKENEGGHAINFLRYEVVDGQERIYVYDNNFPYIETYIYMNSNGMVLQAPESTFSGALDCIALRDVDSYFKNVGNYFDSADNKRQSDYIEHAIFAEKGVIQVEGATEYLIETDVEGTDWVVYEIPETETTANITPLVDDATFTYIDKEYNFEKVGSETGAEFTLSDSVEDNTGNWTSEITHVCPFSDIADSAHHKNIETAYERGYVSGYGEGKYAPNETVTRAQFITMLWRAAGKPTPASTDLSFKDIAADDYCREAIAWGAEKGIVSGYDASTFGRNDPVTRAQATTFIARYCDKVVGMTLDTSDYGFLDINDAREAFRPYINAMANAGLILGYGTTCGPNDKATRGQIASILVRAMDTIG